MSELHGLDPIGEPERRAALAELRRAAEDGRLDPAELDQRSAAVRAATRLDELSALVAGDRRGSAVLPAGFVPAGYSPDDPLVISGRAHWRPREGEWSLPPFVRLTTVLDNVRVNFLKARPAGQLIDIEITGGIGNVRLVVPPGWAVNADRLSRGLGGIRVEADSVPAPGCPLLVIHGSAGVGNLRARTARHHEIRRAERRR